MKLLDKIWLCYILKFHDWTSKAMRGEEVILPHPPTAEDIKKSFADHSKMYCSRCGYVSPLSLNFSKKILA